MPAAATATDWRSRSTVTVERAASILGIGRSSAYALARSGELPTLRLGRRLVVPVAGLRRLLGETSPEDALSPRAADSMQTTSGGGRDAFAS